MRDLIATYPKFFFASGVSALILLALLLVPPVSTADATTIANPVLVTADADCKTAEWPYVTHCQPNSRKVRIIHH